MVEDLYKLLNKIKELNNKNDKQLEINNFYKILYEYINKSDLLIKYNDELINKDYLNNDITIDTINTYTNDKLQKQLKYEFHKQKNGKVYIKERDLNKFKISN